MSTPPTRNNIRPAQPDNIPVTVQLQSPDTSEDNTPAETSSLEDINAKIRKVESLEKEKLKQAPETNNSETTTSECPQNFSAPSVEKNFKETTLCKPKRPISYPWGPESNVVEAPGFNPAKRNSDPPKPVSVANSLKSGKAQVKPFTKESLERLERKTVQLVREYGFQPRRKLSVEDGSRLPVKYEPFPPKLYGRPLEEIDNFIYDEASAIILFSLNENINI